MDSTAAEQLGGKYSSKCTQLTFGDRMSYIEGIDKLLINPPSTMEDEWMRGDGRGDTWADWKGDGSHVICYSRDEWAYVMGPAKLDGERECLADGLSHDGWTPARFLCAANDYIRRKSQEMKLRFLAELTLNEAIAVRLYTGPGYRPINEFCREMFNLSPSFRSRVARCREITYLSTVRHLCNAVKKLARINNDSFNKDYYRSLRGELSDTFFGSKNAQQGRQCAVDYGFTSCSADPAVSKSFMDKDGKNLLWKIKCKSESDHAMHAGADVSILSQFPLEKEVLFPPCTMLLVNVPIEERSSVTEHSWTNRISDSDSNSDSGISHTCDYIEIETTPYFC